MWPSGRCPYRHLSRQTLVGKNLLDRPAFLNRAQQLHRPLAARAHQNVPQTPCASTRPRSSPIAPRPAPPFATKADHSRLGARRTANVDEPSAQDATPKVCLELLRNKGRQEAAFGMKPLPKAKPVCLHQAVKRCRFGPPNSGKIEATKRDFGLRLQASVGPESQTPPRGLAASAAGGMPPVT